MPCHDVLNECGTGVVIEDRHLGEMSLGKGPGEISCSTGLRERTCERGVGLLPLVELAGSSSAYDFGLCVPRSLHSTLYEFNQDGITRIGWESLGVPDASRICRQFSTSYLNVFRTGVSHIRDLSTFMERS